MLASYRAERAIPVRSTLSIRLRHFEPAGRMGSVPNRDSLVNSRTEAAGSDLEAAVEMSPGHRRAPGLASRPFRLAECVCGHRCTRQYGGNDGRDAESSTSSAPLRVCVAQHRGVGHGHSRRDSFVSRERRPCRFLGGLPPRAGGDRKCGGCSLGAAVAGEQPAQPGDDHPMWSSLLSSLWRWPLVSRSRRPPPDRARCSGLCCLQADAVEPHPASGGHSRRRYPKQPPGSAW